MDQYPILIKIFKFLTLNDILVNKFQLVCKSWNNFLLDLPFNVIPEKPLLWQPGFLNKKYGSSIEWNSQWNSQCVRDNNTYESMRILVNMPKSKKNINEVKFRYVDDLLEIKDIYLDAKFVYFTYKISYLADLIHKIDIKSKYCPIQDLELWIGEGPNSKKFGPLHKIFGKKGNIICLDKLYLRDLYTNYYPIYWQIKVKTGHFYKYLSHRQSKDYFQFRAIYSLISDDTELKKNFGIEYKGVDHSLYTSAKNKIRDESWWIKKHIPLFCTDHNIIVLDVKLLLGIPQNIKYLSRSSSCNIEYFEIKSPKDLIQKVYLNIGSVGKIFFTEKNNLDSKFSIYQLEELGEETPILFSDWHLQYEFPQLLIYHNPLPKEPKGLPKEPKGLPKEPKGLPKIYHKEHKKPILQLKIKLNNKPNDINTEVNFGKNKLIYSQGICAWKYAL